MNEHLTTPSVPALSGGHEGDNRPVTLKSGSRLMLQRTQGIGGLTVKQGHDGRSRLDRLYQQAAARIRVPDHHGRTDLEAVLINTAGGVTGGDELSWDLVAGPDTRVTVTTQACEKVYKSDDGAATVDIKLTVAQGARLQWLPQETILFDRAHLHRTITADLHDRSSLLLVEPIIFGRTAMGEALKQGTWVDRWRILHNGELIHAENVRLMGDIAEHLDRVASLPAMTALATVALFGNHAEAKLEGARDLMGAAKNTVASVSCWQVGGQSKLIARVAATGGYDLRAALIPLINHLAHGATNQAAPAVPKIWSL
ncbi:MAG: urease accessory protein UreD [Pseudomonadota bacterium]